MNKIDLEIETDISFFIKKFTKNKHPKMANVLFTEYLEKAFGIPRFLAPTLKFENGRPYIYATERHNLLKDAKFFSDFHLKNN